MGEVVSVRLLIDQNLPAGLVRHLADLYPDSRHVRDFNLRAGPDHEVWEAARNDGLIIVTRDTGFAARSATMGHPPKVVLLHVGNRSKAVFEQVLRGAVLRIRTFAQDPTTGLLVLP